MIKTTTATGVMTGEEGDRSKELFQPLKRMLWFHQQNKTLYESVESIHNSLNIDMRWSLALCKLISEFFLVIRVGEIAGKSKHNRTHNNTNSSRTNCTVIYDSYVTNKDQILGKSDRVWKKCHKLDRFEKVRASLSDSPIFRSHFEKCHSYGKVAKLTN